MVWKLGVSPPEFTAWGDSIKIGISNICTAYTGSESHVESGCARENQSINNISGHVEYFQRVCFKMFRKIYILLCIFFKIL